MQGQPILRRLTFFFCYRWKPRKVKKPLKANRICDIWRSYVVMHNVFTGYGDFIICVFFRPIQFCEMIEWIYLMVKLRYSNYAFVAWIIILKAWTPHVFWILNVFCLLNAFLDLTLSDNEPFYNISFIRPSSVETGFAVWYTHGLVVQSPIKLT